MDHFGRNMLQANFHTYCWLW